MQLVKELTSRLAYVLIPDSIWFRIGRDEYRIIRITDRGIDCEYDPKESPITLRTDAYSDLIIIGFGKEGPKKLVGKPKYMFHCKYL